MSDRHYRVTLDITITEDWVASPDKWDAWEEMLGDETQLDGRVLAEHYLRGTLKWVTDPDDVDPDDAEYVPSGWWACSECGCSTIDYDEDVYCTRSLDEQESTAETIMFNSESDYGEGNDDPGIVCGGCGAHLDLPAGVKMDWSM